MKIEKKIIRLHEAQEIMQALGEEFAIVWNPEFVHPTFELCPLARKTKIPMDILEAIVMDMDGTTTTTEELCLHSLEYMIRRISGKFDKSEWYGLDKIQDYPYVIGNSTAKHVEHLITRYSNFLNIDLFRKEFIKAAIWTIVIGKDEGRKREVINNLKVFKLTELLEKIKLIDSKISKEEYIKISNEFAEQYYDKFLLNLFNDYIRVAIDIYYQRYHEILEDIKAGDIEYLRKQFLDDPNKHLIEPMPGIDVYLALVKGWLDEQFVDFYVDYLIEAYRHKTKEIKLNYSKDVMKNNLQKLIKYFINYPAKLAVVTSSIRYEAEIVLNEVLHVIRQNIENWGVSKGLKEKLIQNYSKIENVYNAFVTASDANEIRLKPHRDLYSIALGYLNIPKTNFGNIIGFEDSESGTTAIRLAGIGVSVALPFHATENHNFEAATHIIKGGIPEVILNYNTFLNVGV